MMTMKMTMMMMMTVTVDVDNEMNAVSFPAFYHLILTRILCSSTFTILIVQLKNLTGRFGEGPKAHS